MKNTIKGLILVSILISTNAIAEEIHANDCELYYINGEYIEECKLYYCKTEPYWVDEKYVEIMTCNPIAG